MCENKTILTNAVVGCIFPDENVNVTYVHVYVSDPNRYKWQRKGVLILVHI